MYEYIAEEIRPVDADKMDPNQAHKSHSGVRIEVPCGVGGCTSLIRIRTVMETFGDIREEGAEMLARSQAHDIPCGGGQVLTGKSIGAGTFDTSFEDWVD